MQTRAIPTVQTRVGRIPPDPPPPLFHRCPGCSPQLSLADSGHGGWPRLPPTAAAAPADSAADWSPAWRFSMCSALVRSNSSLPHQGHHRDPPDTRYPDGSAYAPRQPANWSPAEANWARSTFAPADSANLGHRRAVRIRAGRPRFSTSTCSGLAADHRRCSPPTSVRPGQVLNISSLAGERPTGRLPTPSQRSAI